MSFFKKLKDRMFRSSSKIDEGLDAIVGDGGEVDVETPEIVEQTDTVEVDDSPQVDFVPEPEPEPEPEPGLTSSKRKFRVKTVILFPGSILFAKNSLLRSERLTASFFQNCSVSSKYSWIAKSG